MNVLAIDTSTYVMGVAVLRDSKVAGEMVTHLKKNHSVRLMPAIRAVMDEAEMNPSDLDRIVVAQGPGSYTGVRIGVTTAKAMAWSLGIPIVGVSSLEMLAQNGHHFNGLISPFIDARRGQVFTGLYHYDSGKVQNVLEDRIILHEEWLDIVAEKKERILFLSPDVDKHESLLTEHDSIDFEVTNGNDHLPKAAALGLVGLEKEPEESIHLFAPNYLRLAEAESKWLASQKEKRERD